MLSIERCHFKWSSRVSRSRHFPKANISNTLHFRDKVTNRTQIENHSQAIESWYQFRWPWLTSDPNFKVAVFRNLFLSEFDLAVFVLAYFFTFFLLYFFRWAPRKRLLPCGDLQPRITVSALYIAMLYANKWNEMKWKWNQMCQKRCKIEL